jgi:sugar phosphate isomerase/epimerase
MAEWLVGVFLSSLAMPDPMAAIAQAKSMGLTVVQLPPWPDEFLEGKARDRILDALAEAHLQVSAACAGFPGEDYANMERVTATVGYRDARALPERLRATRRFAALAQAAGAKVLTTHVGVVPEDRKDPAWKRLVEAAQRAADDCAEKGLLLGLETGQETPELMIDYMDAVNRDNCRVNFDPANMILYGTGDPIPALEALAPRVVHVHCKDGLYPAAPGQLGTEVPLGQGKVGIERYLRTLKAIGYAGPLIIEREAGDDRIGDIARGKQLLERIRGELS